MNSGYFIQPRDHIINSSVEYASDLLLFAIYQLLGSTIPGYLVFKGRLRVSSEQISIIISVI